MNVQKEQVARNEALFRQINERVEELADSFDIYQDEDALIDFVCECGNRECLEHIRLTRAEYERVRADPTCFAVVSGHHEPAVARVVEETDRYAIVSKIGEAGDLAARLDPRGGD